MVEELAYKRAAWMVERKVGWWETQTVEWLAADWAVWMVV